MIPVAPFSLLLLLIITLGPLALVALLVWGILLFVQPQRRTNFKQNPWPRILFLAPLLVLVGYYGSFQWTFYQYDKSRQKVLASRQHVLKEPSRLAGMDMPAGTELELEVWGDPDSVSWARFPEPVMVGDAPVLSFKRPRPDLADASWQLRLAHNSELDGWQCDASQLLEMKADPLDKTGFQFVSCFLTEGHQVSAWSPYAAASNVQVAPDFVLDLPAGTLVQAVPGGSIYTNGERDADRWTLRVEADGLRIRAWGLLLERAYFSVDKNKDLLYLRHGQLAEEITLGGFGYSVGTEVSTPNYRVFPNWPLALRMQLVAGDDHAQQEERVHDLLSGEVLDGFKQLID